MNRTLIDNVSQISPDLITHENLKALHETGKSVHESGTGRHKVFRYRVGIQTAIGDIERQVWKDLVRQLAEKTGETEMLSHYLEWVRQNAPWIRNEITAEMGAYELYVSRQHFNRNWWGYVRFNMDYYPDRLTGDPSLISVCPDCCKQAFRTPAEGIRSNQLEQQEVFCPNCKARSIFTYA